MKLTTASAHHFLGHSPGPEEETSMDSRGVVVLSVEGDIDLHTGPDLRSVLADLMAPVTTLSAGPGSGSTLDRSQTAPHGDVWGMTRAVVVDLSAVEFIDSYAVGVLVQGHHLARRSGCAYALVATHPMIHMLFKVTGLAKVMPLHPDVAAAVATLPPAA